MEICGLFLMANASACFNVSDSGVAAPGCLDVRGLPGVPWACDGACAGAVDTGALCAFTACGKEPWEAPLSFPHWPRGVRMHLHRASLSATPQQISYRACFLGLITARVPNTFFFLRLRLLGAA